MSVVNEENVVVSSIFLSLLYNVAVKFQKGHYLLNTLVELQASDDPFLETILQTGGRRSYGHNSGKSSA